MAPLAETGLFLSDQLDIADDLNPAQRKLLGLLGARPAERPVFRAELAAELEDTLVGAWVDLYDELDPTNSLYVNKHRLAQIHGCQVSMLADIESGFTWSVSTARGAVVHKALELSLNWSGDQVPIQIVGEAIECLSNKPDELGDFLQSVSPGNMAELRGACVDQLTKFFDIFPPLLPRWRPVSESTVRYELLDGRVMLAGKVDLVLGRSQGLTAGKVLIDYKTGFAALHHRDDLRYYALIETLRQGLPPRLLATVYLDSGRVDSEEVTEALLWSTVDRVDLGVRNWVALSNGTQEPVLRPGPPCRWCVVLDECEVGKEFLARDELP